MRRVRTPLTAWPAFADLMTILAVVGLTATVIVTTENGTNGDPPAPSPEKLIAQLRERIVALTEENSRLQDRIAVLTEENYRLQDRIRFGARPCLRTPDDRPSTLFRVVVDDAGYRLERRWRPESEGADVEARDADAEADLDALVQRAVAGGQLTQADFEIHAGRIYRHGADEQTFRGSCRFFVQLEKGTASHRQFSQAVGVVGGYFLNVNPGQVNRTLASG